MKTQNQTARHPSSNYKEIKSKLKSEYLKLVDEHTKLKRSTPSHKWNFANWRDYQAVRTAHVAYSMFKGSTFDQIESKWKDPKNPINQEIKRNAQALYESYMKKIVVAEDAVCEECVCGACDANP